MTLTGLSHGRGRYRRTAPAVGTHSNDDVSRETSAEESLSGPATTNSMMTQQPSVHSAYEQLRAYAGP